MFQLQAVSFSVKPNKPLVKFGVHSDEPDPTKKIEQGPFGQSDFPNKDCIPTPRPKK